MRRLLSGEEKETFTDQLQSSTINFLFFSPLKFTKLKVYLEAVYNHHAAQYKSVFDVYFPCSERLIRHIRA